MGSVVFPQTLFDIADCRKKSSFRTRDPEDRYRKYNISI